MFHLQIRRPGSIQPDCDEGTIGHAISTDLIHWEELPVALYKGNKDAENPYVDKPLFTGSPIVSTGSLTPPTLLSGWTRVFIQDLPGATHTCFGTRKRKVTGC